MAMLFRKCWSCHQVKEVFPYSKECKQCYAQNYYHESKIKLAAVKPSVAAGYVTGTLKGVELLMDIGLLTPLMGGAWSEILLGKYKELQAEINSNQETRALMDAQIEEVKEAVKFQLSEGAIEAESLEEAKKVFEARDAEFKQQLQKGEQERKERAEEHQREQAEQKARDEEVRKRFTEAVGKTRKTVTSETPAFVTGEQKAK
jgi:hypothetical protein